MPLFVIVTHTLKSDLVRLTPLAQNGISSGMNASDFNSP
jgi:hypothetical protein